jgi:hypothetical protein
MRPAVPWRRAATVDCRDPSTGTGGKLADFTAAGKGKLQQPCISMIKKEGAV